MLPVSDGEDRPRYFNLVKRPLSCSQEWESIENATVHYHAKGGLESETAVAWVVHHFESPGHSLPFGWNVPYTPVARPTLTDQFAPYTSKIG
jgi:hypothetical protein